MLTDGYSVHTPYRTNSIIIAATRLVVAMCCAKEDRLLTNLRAPRLGDCSYLDTCQTPSCEWAATETAGAQSVHPVRTTQYLMG